MIDVFFYLFATVAIGGAIGVVTQKNPVGSLLFMVATLASIAGIFVLFEAHFLAAIQVIVYAGAIMVLFLFVIMLLNLGHEYRQDLRGAGAIVVGLIATGAMAGILVRTFRGATESEVYAAFPGGEAIDAMIARDNAVGVIAEPLFRDYVVPFELTGILLLIAVVAAIALAKKHV